MFCCIIHIYLKNNNHNNTLILKFLQTFYSTIPIEILEYGFN